MAFICIFKRWIIELSDVQIDMDFYLCVISKNVFFNVKFSILIKAVSFLAQNRTRKEFKIWKRMDSFVAIFEERKFEITVF